jgi:hypothetical protein
MSDSGEVHSAESDNHRRRRKNYQYGTLHSTTLRQGREQLG